MYVVYLPCMFKSVCCVTVCMCWMFIHLSLNAPFVKMKSNNRRTVQSAVRLRHSAVSRVNLHGTMLQNQTVKTGFHAGKSRFTLGEHTHTHTHTMWGRSRWLSNRVRRFISITEKRTLTCKRFLLLGEHTVWFSAKRPVDAAHHSLSTSVKIFPPSHTQSQSECYIMHLLVP